MLFPKRLSTRSTSGCAFEACFSKCQTQACVDDMCIPLLLEQSDFDLYNENN